MKSVVVLLLGAICFIFSLSATAGELIVKLKSDHKPSELIKYFKSSELFESRLLFKDLNLHLVKIKTNLSIREELNVMKDISFVVYAQINHKLKLRKSPNDSSFTEQWSLGSTNFGSIGAQSAWDITTGGTDRLGHELAIAIIDGGFDIKHSDLVDNIWLNKSEIANNGIDDDGNGYVDDVSGWNASSHDGIISIDDHGTHVAGILGAKSNNSTGIAGINWDIKIVPIVAANATTAEITEAYGYAYEQKKLWIFSNGTLGTDITVTNSSFGIDGADCRNGEFPVWNDMFDKMGSVGILSVASVPNEGWDIDKIGDVPSACSSDFIISVTNHDKEGKLAEDYDYRTGDWGRVAGFGVSSVDISAPGQNILSTVNREFNASTNKIEKYAVYSGTSMAAPHVTGSIALMYAAASETLISEYYNDPASTALKIKGILLQSAKRTQNMSTLVSSGGQLDIANAVRAVSAY